MLMASMSSTAPAELDDAHGPSHRPPRRSSRSSRLMASTNFTAPAEIVDAHGLGRELQEIVDAHGPSAPAEIVDAHGARRELREQRAPRRSSTLMAPAVNFRRAHGHGRELQEIVAAHGPSAPAEIVDAHGANRVLQEQDCRSSWPA